MIPTYGIAVRKDGRFYLKGGWVFETCHAAKEAMEILSQGKPIRDFRVMQAVWYGDEISGWIFVDS